MGDNCEIPMEGVPASEIKSLLLPMAQEQRSFVFYRGLKQSLGPCKKQNPGPISSGGI